MCLKGGQVVQVVVAAKKVLILTLAPPVTSIGAQNQIVLLPTAGVDATIPTPNVWTVSAVLRCTAVVFGTPVVQAFVQMDPLVSAVMGTITYVIGRCMKAPNLQQRMFSSRWGAMVTPEVMNTRCPNGAVGHLASDEYIGTFFVFFSVIFYYYRKPQ
tara:strand:+ start:485 stop:955 length:471 start_codon:yes stop_codon:yes gene_type:complete